MLKICTVNNSESCLVVEPKGHNANYNANPPTINPATAIRSTREFCRAGRSTGAATTALPPARERNGKPDRTCRVLVGGHFSRQVQTALKIIAAEERTTVQALLAEGINTVLAKHRKPEIAGIQPASAPQEKPLP